MAASLKQDYAKILKAGANLVMISPDSLEEHRQYALTLLREELPYLYVSDSDLDIARRYGLIRKEEHPHGGFYYRSLWILDRDAMITLQERTLGRQRGSRRISEIIHAHRQRTGRMESHLWLESAGEVTRKLKFRGRSTKRLRCRARLLRNKDNRTIRASMKLWPTRFRGQVSQYSCLTLGRPRSKSRLPQHANYIDQSYPKRHWRRRERTKRRAVQEIKCGTQD